MKFENPSFEEVSEKEWLITNGIGGYASSTISGANTRRYHGLLVASLRPPTERIVIVSKIEEAVTNHKGNIFNLSSNQFPGTIHPIGYEYITGFERDSFPKTKFKGPGFKLSKTVFMLHHSNTVVIRYENEGKDSIMLELNPFYVYRDYHSLFREQKSFNFYREARDKDVSVIHPHFGASPIYVLCPGAAFQPHVVWYKNYLYKKETERGLPDMEDTCSVGVYTHKLKAGKKCHILFTIEEDKLNVPCEKLYDREKSRLAKLYKESAAPSTLQLSLKDKKFYRDLAVSGDQFLVRRASNDGHTIIAGYHWFTDWGRDTMIAMRGLVIARGKHELAKNIIRTFLQYMSGGLIPNRFPDHGEVPEYNTIDASLWLFIVLYEFDKKFDDAAFIAECMPRLEEILIAYRDGTKFNIHMTEEGLVSGGEDLSQLTWMDAKVGDYVVTPRQGCPVEINALWYNALSIYHEFQKNHHAFQSDWGKLALQVKGSFRKYFLNQDGYLNDVVIPGEKVDDAFRPNQVYALSLPFTMLTIKESKEILKQITKKLVTSFGLRSLSMDHPDFVLLYTGDQWHRDKAYHQGTVWTYLLGEYFLAFLKLNKYSAAAKEEVLEQMSGLKEHFYHSDGIHGISEVFDGEIPGPGKGCIHQAWSVGMLLSVFDSLNSTTA